MINDISRELITPKSQGGSAAQESFEVAKTGDARIGFVGFSSVGESGSLCLYTAPTLKGDLNFF